MRFPRRLVLDPRHRFRDRLLAGMVLVALLPLAVFGLLVAADLGGITSRTVDEAHRTIRGDLESRQQTAVTDRGRLADARLAAIAAEVRQLRDEMTRALSAVPATASLPGPLVNAGAVEYTGSGSQTLLARVGTEAATAAAAQAAGSLGTSMAGIRRAYPEVETAWVMRRSIGMLLTVPGFDVAGALAAHRLTPALPQVRGSQDVFAASQTRMATSDEGSTDWVQPGTPQSVPGPYWTDVYPTMEDGNDGVTVWMPLADGDTLVGVDLSLTKLTGDILTPAVTDATAADAILLSSSNMVLAGTGDLSRDFSLPAQAAGAFLSAPPSAGFASSLHTLERTGRFTVLQAQIGGSPREFIAAPVYTSHWILATAVPVSDFEPDLAALSRGVESGIHRLYFEALPVLLLLLLLAFLLATVLARRLVVPVRALTTSAERLAQGHTDEPVPHQGDDEVGLLSEALERMRREINTSREALLAAARELEGRVADRTEELRDRNEELVALNALAATLTRSLDPAELLGGAVEAVRAILPVAAAAGYTMAHDLPWMVTHHPARLGESADEMAEGVTVALSTNALTVRQSAAGRVVAIPAGAGGAPLGALAALVSSSVQVPERIRILLGAVADQVGLALRTAQFAAEGRELAVLEERTRLARRSTTPWRSSSPASCSSSRPPRRCRVAIAGSAPATSWSPPANRHAWLCRRRGAASGTSVRCRWRRLGSPPP